MAQRMAKALGARLEPPGSLPEGVHVRVLLGLAGRDGADPTAVDPTPIDPTAVDPTAGGQRPERAPTPSPPPDVDGQPGDGTYLEGWSLPE
jgi:hypothetical protein